MVTISPQKNPLPIYAIIVTKNLNINPDYRDTTNNVSKLTPRLAKSPKTIF